MAREGVSDRRNSVAVNETINARLPPESLLSRISRKCLETKKEMLRVDSNTRRLGGGKVYCCEIRKGETNSHSTSRHARNVVAFWLQLYFEAGFAYVTGAEK